MFCGFTFWCCSGSNYDAFDDGGNVSQADLSMEAHAPGLTTGIPPFSLPAKKMAIWLFIIADAATFAACLVAYGFLRNGTPHWPRPFHSITNVALMTFILLTSSLTMLFGVRSAKAGDKAGAFRWILITAVLGIAFALLHIREWLALIDEGMTMFHNPWGTGLFGASFFSITGLHLTHVTVGVVALLAVGIRYKGGRYKGDDIEVVGLYWHFVDLVWMFVVPFVYLLNLKLGS
jgi:cytochrome c oxidase subunit III